ncbi:MAG: histidine kinase, partial [Anaerolineales bacterium]
MPTKPPSFALIVLLWALAAFVATVPGRYQQLLDAEQQTRSALRVLGLSTEFYATYFVAFEVAGMLVYAITAVLIFWRKSDDWMTVFVALTLLTFGAAAPSPMHLLVTTQPAGKWLGILLQAVGSASFLIFFFLFLDGRFVPNWTRVLAIVVAAWALAWLFFPALNPYAWPFPFPFLTFIVWFGAGLYAQLYRYRHVSTPEQRQQTKWVVVGLTLAVLGDFVTHVPKYIFPVLARPGIPNVVYLLLHQPFFSFSQMLVPITIAISMARYRLWDIDLILNRTIVYGALTAIVVGIYTIVVGALGALFQAQGNLFLSILATGLSAVLFQPLRRRLHHAVNRMMYGERDDPAEVLSRLGQRLSAAIAPDVVLPTIVETVAQALKLPYVAIELATADGRPPATVEYPSSGPPPAQRSSVHELVHLPLIYQSETIGQLIVAPRAPGEAFTPGDHRLLEEITHQAGPVAHTVRLTADLQRSRERIVTAREEERRRLRRDLHDGLGPTLASQTLKLDAALDLLATDPEAAVALLREIKAQTQATVTDIRRLVYELRPPALDELGLVSALRESVLRHVNSHELATTFEVPPHGLPPLSAAVEVAAYRIALEALTNVVRHAHARRCLVRLCVAEGKMLQVEVSDDGVG